MRSRAQRRNRRARTLFRTILYLVLLILLFRVIGIASLQIRTTVMAPSISPGDRLLVLPVREIKRDDIVVFVSPFTRDGRLGIAFPRLRNRESDDPPHGLWTIRRVIALPDDTVVIDQDEIRIISGNERFRYDNRAPQRAESFPGIRQLRLSSGEYFVIADSASFFDSREWGPVRRDEIIGRAVVRFWPTYRTTAFRRE